MDNHVNLTDGSQLNLYCVESKLHVMEFAGRENRMSLHLSVFKALSSVHVSMLSPTLFQG